eukprot:6471198-Amphidinium_carterae.1
MHWKNKIDVAGILEGTQDLRSTTGLWRAVNRRIGPNAKAGREVEGAMLNSFYNLVQACRRAHPTVFSALSTQDLEKLCVSLESDGHEFGPVFKKNVLMRKVSALCQVRDYQKLLAILNPWESAPFSWREPCLSGLVAEGAPTDAIVLFKKVMFDEVLCKLILAGAEKVSEVVSISECCLAMTALVDTVMLDAISAQNLAECDTTWKCLLALGTVFLDVELEEIGQPRNVP